MGLFSSRKADDSDTHLTTPTPPSADNDKSVVHVIRSRFYGKNKGKERAEGPQSFSATQGASSAQTLSSSAAAPAHAPRQPSPLSKAPAATRGAGPSILRVQKEDQPLPALPPRNGKLAQGSMGPPPSPTPTSRSRGTVASTRPQPSNLASPSPRKQTDNVTTTLAQRLNELAVANSEGLLNEDEYRLLRQNLFERFATSTVVPTETPIVPVARPRPRGTGANSEGQPIPRPLSNFQVEVNRSPSIRSKTSVTSGVANFLRRATSRRTPSGSTDHSDTSSIFSATSTASHLFKRGLSKKSSSSSVRTTTSRTQADTISISSRQTGSDRIDNSPHFPLASSRSAASIRRLATPPSSFPARAIGTEPSRHTGFASDVFDEDHLKTAVEIRQEIAAVEAEARRLMDAFNGLEMTTLAKVQRHQGRKLVPDRGQDSSWTLVPDGERSMKQRVTIAESDVISIRSVTSMGTAPSIARSAHSSRRPRVRGGLSASVSLTSTRPVSLHRKGSASSIGSQERRGGGKDSVPPVPALPTSYGHLGAGSGSNVSLGRSTGHLPMSALPEDEVSVEGTEDEMEDIRRRREEVSRRYASRLEYLRAKLKGAELHEKLARR